MGNSARFSELTDPSARARVLWREKCVLDVIAAMQHGLTQRQAIQRILERPEYVAASYAAILRWKKRYEEEGIDGLVDQRRGRAGRKPIAASIPQDVIASAAAAAIEHGTLGPSGRPNYARAYRNIVLSHPHLPAEIRASIHGNHASKSYVPRSVRDAMRTSPLAADILRGPKATRLALPIQPCTYDDVPPGRMITADDMTANVYCWMEAPTPTGYIVGRPQILAFLDVGSLRWMLLHVVLRKSGSYNRDDVWGAVGDLMETYGVYPEWLFEGGRIWRSDRVLGERTGLTDNDRFGGLQSLGCKLHRSQRPQSKHIEQAFNLLQSESDRIWGYVGRDERRQSREDIQSIIAACKSGALHPRGVLPHISQYAQHLQESCIRLNAERSDGKILRGRSPDEAWMESAPQLPELPRNAAWMFRSNVSSVTVRRDGVLRVRMRSGKYSDDYYFTAPELIKHAGRRVIVYWSDRNPTADAIVLTSEKPPRLLCTAQYVEPIPRFDATDEQMAASIARRKAILAAARTEIIRLRPYLTQPTSQISPARLAAYQERTASPSEPRPTRAPAPDGSIGRGQHRSVSRPQHTVDTRDVRAYNLRDRISSGPPAGPTYSQRPRPSRPKPTRDDSDHITSHHQREGSIIDQIAQAYDRSIAEAERAERARQREQNVDLESDDIRHAIEPSTDHSDDDITPEDFARALQGD